MSNALLKASKIVGSRAKLAKLIRTNPETFKKWLNNNIRVALQYALEIERLTEGQVTWQEISPHLRHYEKHWSLILFSTPSHALPLFTHVQIPLSRIVVPEEDLTDHLHEIRLLSEDIQVYGLQRPIGIDQENRLIFGKKRFHAHQLLGKKTIACLRLSFHECMKHQGEATPLCKNLVFSERMNIGFAIENYIGRLKQPLDPNGEETVYALPGRIGQLIATLLGFGSHWTYWQAKKIYLSRSNTLITALDQEGLSVFKASLLLPFSEAERACMLAWPGKAIEDYTTECEASTAASSLIPTPTLETTP